jgi:co-chaperonin GroES (HSP10)
MTAILTPDPGLVLPKHVAGETPEPASRLMPKPAGFHILCAIPKAKESFEQSVLIKAAKTMADEEAATTVLFVLDLGPDAYGDKARFPSGPWCKKGDYIVVRTYSGTRFKIFGQEFRILNDDQVEAVVDDPRGILRVQA